LIGKVFVSLGQATTGEKDAAQQVGKLLKDEFHLTAYLAITVQGLRERLIPLSQVHQHIGVAGEI
jgi:hypothetical protein